MQKKRKKHHENTSKTQSSRSCFVRWIALFVAGVMLLVLLLPLFLGRASVF